MRFLRVLAVLGVVLVVSLIAGAYAAGTEDPTMTPGEARVFTAEALTASGARDVKVQDDGREVLLPDQCGDPIPVYMVPAEISGNRVDLYVPPTGDQAVCLDDAMPDGGYVLDEDQFKRLEAFRFNPAGERIAESRRGPAILAGALVLVVGMILLVSVLRARTQSNASSVEA